MQTPQEKDPLTHPKKNNEGETASELVHRHLEDEAHETTEEEIRNVALELHTDFTEQSALNADAVEEKLRKDHKKTGSAKDDPDDVLNAPADVLGS